MPLYFTVNKANARIAEQHKQLGLSGNAPTYFNIVKANALIKEQDEKLKGKAPAITKENLPAALKARAEELATKLVDVGAAVKAAADKYMAASGNFQAKRDAKKSLLVALCRNEFEAECLANAASASGDFDRTMDALIRQKTELAERTNRKAFAAANTVRLNQIRTAAKEGENLPWTVAEANAAASMVLESREIEAALSQCDNDDARLTAIAKELRLSGLELPGLDASGVKLTRDEHAVPMTATRLAMAQDMLNDWASELRGQTPAARCGNAGARAAREFIRSQTDSRTA